MPTIKQTLSYLLLGQKGGQNRIQIIESLKERPYNLNQLAEMLDLNYRTIKHHVDVLLKNELVTTSKSGGYGEVYFLTRQMEENMDLFESIIKKLKDITTSPKFFQNVLKQTDDAVIIVDNDGETIFWNQGAEKQFGYGEEEVLGKQLSIFSDSSFLTKTLENLEKGKKIIGIQTKGNHKSGEMLDISVTLDAIHDNEQKTVGYSILSRDITRLKKNEEEIRYLNSLLISVKDIGQLIERESDISTLMQGSCDILVNSRDYLDISIALLDERKVRIIPMGHSGKHQWKKWEITIDGKGRAPKCIKSVLKSITKELVKNTSKECADCKYCKHSSDHQTLVIPMLYRNNLVGIFSICFAQPHQLLEKEVDLLEEIASDLAHAIFNIKAEHEIQLREERFNLAQRAANIGSWDWDIKTGGLYWSERIEPMFGFKNGEFGRTYEAFLECVHPEDRQYVIDSVNGCIEDGRDYDIEHRIVWPDGTIRWVSETGNVIRNRNGKAIRMLGVVRDITEEKNAEEQILMANARLHYLLTSTTAVIYTAKTTEDYGATFISENVAQVVGYKSEEFLKNSKLWIDHVHPDDIDRINGEISRLFKEGVHVFEYRFKRKDGKYIWVRDEMKLVRDKNGEPFEIVGYWVDISERKKWEEAVQREKDAIRTIIESTGTMMAYFDTDFNYVNMNSAYAKRSGHTTEELIGKNLFDRFPDEKNKAIFEQVRDTGKSVKLIDKPFKNPDNPERGFTYWDMTLDPVKDKAGNVQGLILSLVESTDRKKSD